MCPIPLNKTILAAFCRYMNLPAKMTFLFGSKIFIGALNSEFEK